MVSIAPPFLAVPVAITKGGTGATTASAARTALGLGTAALANVGGAGGVAPLDGSTLLADIYIPSGITRDTELTTAVAAEATARNTAIATAIATLVGTAPGVLDTLGEISDAINDDANLYTTLAALIAGKVDVDAELTALAAVTSAANKLPYFTGSGAAAVTDFTPFARTLLDDADASTMRTTLGSAIGTNVQAYHASLAAVAAVTVTAAGTALLDDVDAAAQRTTLGLGTIATMAATSFQAVSGKNVVSGYVGLDTGMASLVNLGAAQRRFSYPQRAATVSLARGNAAVTTDVWLTDSFGHEGSSAASTTSCIALYEAMVARTYNTLPRVVSDQPVELWNGITVTTDGAMAWPDIPSGQHAFRGPNYANKKINAGQHATITVVGTGVTIGYTTQQTGGAVVAVDINGVASGTIDNRDGALPAGTFDSGHELHIANPSNSYGTMVVTLTHNGTGTSFELEGLYPETGNQAGGIRVRRADRSGQTLQTLVDPTDGATITQFVGNILPEIITIICGINDAAPTGANRSASLVAADLVTLLANLRAEYSTLTPAIRYVFQNDCSYAPATWLSDYRVALRQVCVDHDVLFLDMNEAVGTTRGSDPLNETDDALHPNDVGHRALAQMVADVTSVPSNGRAGYVPLNAATALPQTLTGTAGQMILRGTGEPSISLFQDSGAASPANTDLGYFGFRGAVDAFGTTTTGATAAVRGRGEALFTPTSAKTGLRFLATPAGSVTAVVVGGFSGAGDWFVGTSLAAAPLTVDASGNLVTSGRLAALGGLSVGRTSIASTRTADIYAYGSPTPTLALRSALGTIGTPTQVLTSTFLGTLWFDGYTSGGAFSTGGGAAVAAVAGQDFTNAAQGTTLRLYSTPNGTTAVVEILRLDASASPAVRIANALSVGSLGALTAGVGIQLAGGPMQGTDGVVATPAYSFTSDPNTGLYSAGADILGFSIGGANRLSISTTAITPLDGMNIVLNATTGMKIGTATTQKLGFYNATPVVQPGAYTQTFATADKTHAARTATAAATTAVTQTTPWGYASQAQGDAVATKFNQLVVDVADTAQLLNALIDDLQALGLVA